MTIQELFESCGNLSHLSYWEVHNFHNNNRFCGKYTSVFMRYGEGYIVTDFKIVEDRNVIIWVKEITE